MPIKLVSLLAVSLILLGAPSRAWSQGIRVNNLQKFMEKCDQDEDGTLSPEELISASLASCQDNKFVDGVLYAFLSAFAENINLLQKRNGKTVEALINSFRTGLDAACFQGNVEPTLPEMPGMSVKEISKQLPQ